VGNELWNLVVERSIAPVAYDTRIQTVPNTSYVGQLPVSQEQGLPLTLTIVRNASQGAVTIIEPETGRFRYTPYPGARGKNTFTFLVSDGQQNWNTATVEIMLGFPMYIPLAKR
jgi:hypothetical protein